MKEVKIQVENTSISDLTGGEPEMWYAPLRFNEAHFLGYWVSNKGTTLSFYLGCQCFLCKNTTYNVELFESILN
jgi:hypothetical protein